MTIDVIMDFEFCAKKADVVVTGWSVYYGNEEYSLSYLSYNALQELAEVMAEEETFVKQYKYAQLEDEYYQRKYERQRYGDEMDLNEED
jgi:hypothetical protein